MHSGIDEDNVVLDFSEPPELAQRKRTARRSSSAASTTSTTSEVTRVLSYPVDADFDYSLLLPIKMNRMESELLIRDHGVSQDGTFVIRQGSGGDMVVTMAARGTIGHYNIQNSQGNVNDVLTKFVKHYSATPDGYLPCCLK